MEHFALTERDVRHLREFFSARQVYYAPSLPLSAQAYLAQGVAREFQRPVVWVTDSPHTLNMAFQNLVGLFGETAPTASFFPSRETSPNADLIGERLRTLHKCLASNHPSVIATCVQALLQPTPAPQTLRNLTLTLRVGDRVHLDAWLTQCTRMEYRTEVEVTEKRQLARRGGIVDIWPVTEPWPIRVEWVGDEIASLRRFDPRNQRSLDKESSVLILPPDELTSREGATPASLADYLPPNTVWMWSEPESIRHHAELYRALLPEEHPERPFAREFDVLRTDLTARSRGGELVIGLDRSANSAPLPLDLSPCESVPVLHGVTPRPDVLDQERAKLLEQLLEKHRSGWTIYLFFATEGSRDRFFEIHPDCRSMFARVAPLSEGFVSAALRLAVIAESDLYGVRKTFPRRYELRGRRDGAPAGVPGERITSWMDIQPGELVVHVDHGIGKYLGLYEIEFDGRVQEALVVEYAAKARLYVPVSQAHLLSRYVGVGRRRPELHALGGRRWKREKQAAEKAVRDLAASLLETQARREVLKGHAFAADTPWQHEFEAAFPHQETPDQLRAWQDVKADMASQRPMDRLVCGDVGYGKTEIAMRAAFKAVLDGCQVAMLVPTTVLAQQHFDTFTERMSAYPIIIEMLSRFRTRAQQAEIVRRMAEGAIDIVIGTHRLLQPDIRFANLGLVIIDEEQRFGVRHKEHLKRLRETVDVLTLTATPIPRTLYMSLTGARDLSIIETPPLERLPIETTVAQYSDDLVRQAVLRELNRGGQVYCLHNRISTMRLAHEHLRRIVPEARIAVAHGQMQENDLAEVMHAFARGEYDVLLCTTIIESGVDIPNVNTILIERADRFGMADLYQLRGRVGRYKNRAYAYLLLPRHGHLYHDARRRISAIQSHSSLGAGFRLALRDLEIRGAGNLLGPEQSGHVAAVGFELYCQLLRRTIARLKNEPLPPVIEVRLKLDFVDSSPATSHADTAAAIPTAYVEDEALRVSLYRRMAALVWEREVNDLHQELRDRFGPVPEPLERLLLIARIRIVAHEHGIQEIETREDKIMITRNNDYLMPSGRFPRFQATAVTERLKELLDLIRDLK